MSKKPKKLKFGYGDYAYAYEAGVCNDKSGSWPAGIDICAQNGLDLKQAKKLQKWLKEAILWLEKEK